MMTHYLETKKQYPDCILFYRLGDFYGVIAKESFHSPNRRAVAREEHQAIVDAIRRSSGRDDLEAYAAVRRHMEASRDLVLREVQAE